MAAITIHKRNKIKLNIKGGPIQKKVFFSPCFLLDHNNSNIFKYITNINKTHTLVKNLENGIQHLVRKSDLHLTNLFHKRTTVFNNPIL